MRESEARARCQVHALVEKDQCKANENPANTQGQGLEHGYVLLLLVPMRRHLPNHSQHTHKARQAEHCPRDPREIDKQRCQ